MNGIRQQVVLVDQQPIILTALQQLLEGTADFEVVAMCTSSDKAFFEIMERVPDLVIMDVELPGRGATATAEQICNRLPATKVVFYTTYNTDIYIDFALKIGVSGYILRTESVSMLIEGLRSICKGERFFSNDVLERMDYDSEREEYAVRTHTYLSTLTLRQLQVLRHLVYGKSVKEVAKEMTLSERAIESHKYRIMQKLGIHDRVELTRFAIREGLMPA